MSEFNREQVIKALKLCNEGGDDGCVLCPYAEVSDCYLESGKDALALIEELIKENEDLKFDIDSFIILRQKQREEEHMEHQEQMRLIHEIYDGVVQLKVNTIQRLQEKVALHFGTYTLKDEIKVVDAIKLIDQIAREMLEENNGNL